MVKKYMSGHLGRTDNNIGKKMLVNLEYKHYYK